METLRLVNDSKSINVISECLNALLADHYILMNKTSLLLIEDNVYNIQHHLDATYADLKKNVAAIVEFCRNNQAQVSISINNFLHHTRLIANTPVKNVESFIEQLLLDYETTINNTHEDHAGCKSEGVNASELLYSITSLLKNNLIVLQKSLNRIKVNHN